MIWGCMSAKGVGEVHISEDRMNGSRYIDMLEEVLVPSIIKLVEDNEKYYFQKDNASCYTAQQVACWFRENQKKCLDSPPSHRISHQ